MLLPTHEDDGLFLHSIKPHSLDKIVRHNFYADVFATAMSKTWPQRAYIGLYSGPGRARVEGTGEIVETSAMSAIRLSRPFTHYIFVDKDSRSTEALEARIRKVGTEAKVTIINNDVNEAVPAVLGALPTFSRENGLICFCFVDPFAADLKFSTIQALSSYKIDFLILLMLGRDVRTNFKRYYDNPDDSRIADLLDMPTWREEYRTGGDKNVVRFVLRKFDERMMALGYHTASDDLVHQVKIAKKGVFLYSLVFYTRHELGKRFWRTTLEKADPQLGLGL